MKKENALKINKLILASLILIQPIIDIIRNNIVNDIQFLGVSLFEMINLLLIAGSCLLSLYACDNRRRMLKFILIYGLAFLSYTIFHLINISNFNLNVYENATHDYIKEIYYLVKSFITPILLIIILLYSDIKKEECIKLIETFTLIIVILIVLGNIFKFSATSYPTNDRLRYSIFDWFTFKSDSTYSYYLLTSKGIFSSANQLSAILLMISPIILYQAYKNKKRFNYCLLILTSVAMLMLGTKTANVGIVLVYIAFILLYCFFKIIKKQQHSIKDILLIMTLIFILFCFSPIAHNFRYKFENVSGNQENNEINSKEEEEQKEVEKMLKEIKTFNSLNLGDEEIKKINYFINNYQYEARIHSYIIDNYKLELHPEFWCRYLQNYEAFNYRTLKTAILQNIYKENKNLNDIFWGMGGYTLNYIYTESDYSYQIYCYGILGIITLFGVQFGCILFIAYKIIKNRNEEFNLESSMYLMAPILGLIIAYFSGHVLERALPLLIISLLIGLNFNNLLEKE